MFTTNDLDRVFAVSALVLSEHLLSQCEIFVLLHVVILQPAQMNEVSISRHLMPVALPIFTAHLLAEFSYDMFSSLLLVLGLLQLPNLDSLCRHHIAQLSFALLLLLHLTESKHFVYVSDYKD